MQSVLKKSDTVLFSECTVATKFFTRFRGLMGKAQLQDTEAIVFPKCNSIHTFFMRIPIDVLFVSEEGIVIEIIESLLPWRMVIPRLKAKHTIEVRAQRCRELGLKTGDQLHCQGAWE